MNKELELKLVEKYPKILRDYGGDPRETPMAWGFEMDEGWYNLVDNTLEKVQLLCDLFTQHNGEEFQLVLEQAKEKFSFLCLYYSVVGASKYKLQYEIIVALINKAEHESGHICEITGNYGYTCVRGGWYKTLCMEKAFELGYEAKNPEVQKWWEEKREKAKAKEKGENNV
jgi:hypothetical protein